MQYYKNTIFFYGYCILDIIPVGITFFSISKNIGSPLRQKTVMFCPECVIIRITEISSLFGIISESSSCDKLGKALLTSDLSFRLSISKK